MDELNENEILENENSEELSHKKSKKLKVIFGVIGAAIAIGLVIFILSVELFTVSQLLPYLLTFSWKRVNTIFQTNIQTNYTSEC